MFNVAKSLRFKVVPDNPASHVEKPDPKNERDRIASTERNQEMRGASSRQGGATEREPDVYGHAHAPTGSRENAPSFI